MAPHKGPDVPHRTLRKLSIEKGTDPQHFADDEANYNPQGGHPVGPSMPAGTYEDPDPGVTSVGPKSIDVTNPMVLDK